MKVKLLNRDEQLLKKKLSGKSIIMSYGAGSYAETIKRLLEGYGYRLDYALVDDALYCKGNTYMVLEYK